jgi:hypothetical protein
MGIGAFAAMTLAGCARIECAVLCERFVGEEMHNARTGEKAMCGGVQKGDITTAELDDISACVADHASKGFVLDTYGTAR